jgi:heat shock protein HspQ
MARREQRVQRFAVGAQVRVKNPGINGVVARADDKPTAMGEYWHSIQTERGERRDPGCNLELIPTPVTNSGSRTVQPATTEGKLLPPEQAIPLLRSQIDELVEILRHDDPSVDGWQRISLTIVERTFGRHSRNANHFGCSVSYAHDTEEGAQAAHLRDVASKKGMLRGFIKELEIIPPSAPSSTASEKGRMTAVVDQVLLLGAEVESFPLGRCSQDDSDEQTAFLYGFKDIAKRFVGAAMRVGDTEVRAALSKLDLDASCITDAYDLKADLMPLIDTIREKANDPDWAMVSSHTSDFIDPGLVSKIRSIESSRFNLSKLVRFAEELNENYRRANYLSCALLIRAIVNHVPPLFGCSAFSQVVAGSGRSVKAILNVLEEGARDIGDLHSHETVDRYSAPPTKNQIEPYKPSVEILFREIERRVGLSAG